MDGEAEFTDDMIIGDRQFQPESASTSLITQSADIRSSQVSSSLSRGVIVVAISGLLLAGVGFTSASPSTSRPAPTEGSNAGVVVSTSSDFRAATERQPLLAFVGAWAGDDLNACLELMYETRSTVQLDDISA
jgi:hypothetical protein